MKDGQFKLYLQPTHDGAFTRLRLSGSVVTALPPCELRRWLRQLASWGDAPVELVLPVDVGSVEWFELWSYAVSEVPARHLQVRFSLERPDPRRRGRDVV